MSRNFERSLQLTRQLEKAAKDARANRGKNTEPERMWHIIKLILAVLVAVGLLILAVWWVSQVWRHRGGF